MARFIHFLILATSSLLLVGMAAAASSPPLAGSEFPEFSIVTGGKSLHVSYLGLRHSGPFTVSEINAPLVIIEIFSMYCPYCQREAPNINALFKKIQDTPRLKDKIKLIGIGAGNSPFEVDFFRKKFHVPFPLFPDQDFSIHKILGEVRTPYFFVIRNRKNGRPLVIYSKLGKIGDMEKFLRDIVQKAGVK